jgi:hypothetical protein
VRIWLFVAIAACSPSPRGPASQPDASTTGSGADAAPALCFEPAITGTAMIGNANVQDCAIWNNVARMTGMVTLTRTASSFSLDFANGLSFTGAITGDQVALTHVEPHTFSDGCGWQSTETLTGTLDATTCVITLAYDYAEMVTMSNGACATPCSGHADVSLQITPIVQ